MLTLDTTLLVAIFAAVASLHVSVWKVKAKCERRLRRCDKRFHALGLPLEPEETLTDRQ